MKMTSKGDEEDCIRYEGIVHSVFILISEEPSVTLKYVHDEISRFCRNIMASFSHNISFQVGLGI